MARQNSAIIRFVSPLGQGGWMGPHRGSGNDRFSAEFNLALACCRAAFGNLQSPSAPLAGGVDWPAFLRLAAFHRIEGLAWMLLSQHDISVDVAAKLKAAAQRIAETNLRVALESQALVEDFKAASCELVFLKGLPLGVLAYANPAIKAGIDIDLLIDPANLNAAVEILRGRGYVLVEPGREQDLARWYGWRKDSEWSRGRDDMRIDLHVRPTDSKHLLHDLDAHSPRQTVPIATGVSVPTFATDELFAHLSVHGATSAWFRLKWISDFAAFIARFEAVEIEQLYRSSHRRGVGRAAAQALLLADSLFDSLEKCPALRVDLLASRANVFLHQAALNLVSRPPAETAEMRRKFAIHWTQLLLKPGVRFKLLELQRQASAALMSLNASS